MGTVRVELPWGITEVQEGTDVGEVLAAGPDQNGDTVAAVVNNRLVGLDALIGAPCSVRPVSEACLKGEEVVRRTAAVLLHGVCRALYPGAHLKVGQSLRGGYHYTVSGEHPPLEEMATSLTARFRREAEQGRQIIRTSVSLDHARALLEQHHPVKARLLRVWAGYRVPLVTCLGFNDIRHGPYALNARCVRHFRIEPYREGLILVFDKSYSQRNLSEAGGSVLFQAYAETRKWNALVGVATVADLNEQCLNDQIRRVIQIAEGQQEKKIAQLADSISDPGRSIRVVCVAGPSSAGKTTFVKRLSIQLLVNGITPRTLSLDDYYVDREKTPRDEHGDYDFEALEAIDLPLFHEQLRDLVAGKEVMTPIFDFKSGLREPQESWRPRELGPNEILLVEGIHGLNPELTKTVPAEQKFRIFINALTQLAIDDHNRIRTSDTRLLRRIVRDRRYRGYNAAETILRWPKVREGEEKHIFPFQEHCDAMFNSALVYEAAVLKNFAQRYLMEIPDGHEAQAKGYALRRFLDLFVPYWPDRVPKSSILREFIGGSAFSYR